MATEKPQLISTSQRLRFEQHIFWLERIALFPLCILFILLINSFPQDAIGMALGLTFTQLVLLFTSSYYSESYNKFMKVVPSNINLDPSVKTQANQLYTEADRLNDERLLFWMERIGISLFFLFLLFTDPTVGVRRFADVSGSLFFVSNVTYFLLFLGSEELYVQENNTTSLKLKETNEGRKSSQSCNSYVTASGSSVDLKKAKLVEVEKNEKVISESKAIFDQQALKKAEDKLRKLKNENENLKASHVEELRKAIELCKGKYKMKLKEKKYKLDEEYSKVIEELQEEYSEEFIEVVEECNKYHQMKLNKNKDKLEEELKKMKDEHEENRQKWKEEFKKAMEEHKEDHRKWEEEKTHLVAELVAAKASSEHYQYLLRDGDYSFSI